MPIATKICPIVSTFPPSLTPLKIVLFIPYVFLLIMYIFNIL